MPRINPVTSQNTPAQTQPILEAVKKKLGRVPNLLAAVGHSPAALKAYLDFNQAMSSASLPAAVREQLAVAIAGENSCAYCAAAHTAIGKSVGLDDRELALNLNGQASDEKIQAAVTFARTIVARRGWVADEDLAAVREAGYTDQQIVEIVATVAINTFTNYFNHIASTDIDFPKVLVPEPALT